MAADEGDQDLPTVMPDAQAEVTEAASSQQIHVDRPIGGFKVRLDGFNQLVNPAIQDRTAIEIDDPMTATPVIAGTQDPIGGTLQRNQGAIAVAKAVRGRPDRADRGELQSTQAMQGLNHLVLLKASLRRVDTMLQAAASATFSKDAGRALAVLGGILHANQIGLQVPLG
jgi:hypothetical protein